MTNDITELVFELQNTKIDFLKKIKKKNRAKRKREWLTNIRLRTEELFFSHGFLY